MRNVGNCRKTVGLRNRASDESGLSLVELIIMVVVLGALIAIAIPVFASVKSTADQDALSAAAAEGAFAVAVAIANDEGASIEDAAASASSSDIFVSNVGSQSDVDWVCVRAESVNGAWAQTGSAPDCTGNSWGTPRPGA